MQGDRLTTMHADPSLTPICATPPPSGQWRNFAEILNHLHGAGLYLHPHQLAEFLVVHGVPVDLHYVPAHLQQRASMINRHYRGDLAQLETATDQCSGYLERLSIGH